MPDTILQEQLTEVFFLFSEYIDVHHPASVPYIREMSYSDDGVPSFLMDLNNLLEFFKYEKRVDKYYDKNNLEGLLFPYKVLDYPEVDRVVRTTLRDYDVLNWRDELDENNDVIEWHGNQVLNDTCAKVYERTNTNSPEQLIHSTLFVFDNAIEGNGSLFVFRKENTELSLSYQSSIRALHKWLSENCIPRRKFQYSAKHGENGKGGWFFQNGTHTALLECDCAHAQELLHKAIGDAHVNNDLWFYDSEYDKVLYFEYQNESPQKEYHGYHLKPGDPGYDKVNIDLLRQVQDLPY